MSEYLLHIRTSRKFRVVGRSAAVTVVAPAGAVDPRHDIAHPTVSMSKHFVPWVAGRYHLLWAAGDGRVLYTNANLTARNLVAEMQRLGIAAPAASTMRLADVIHQVNDTHGGEITVTELRS